MRKKEKFILIFVFMILAIVLNGISCYMTGLAINNFYYFFYSLTPYIIYSSIIVSIKNRALIYITAAFLLIIDFLMKININPEISKYKQNVIYSWMLMTPLVLVSLVFIVFALFITGVWYCKKFGISKFEVKFNIPEQFQFEDDELAKFILIILSFGFLINFQNIVNLCTTTLSLILNYNNAGSISTGYFLNKILVVVLAMLPYFIFVGISYFINCKWISYIVGFTAVIFDIYLKVVAALFLNSGYNIGSSFTEVLYSIFNPLTFILFIPAVFAILFYGKKIFNKNQTEEITETEPKEA